MEAPQRSEQQPFRQALIDYYKRADPAGTHYAKCMLLDEPLPDVIACRIWMRAASSDELAILFDLLPESVNCPRNGLLLCKPIEDAFDALRACFYWDFFFKCVQIPRRRRDAP